MDERDAYGWVSENKSGGMKSGGQKEEGEISIQG